MLPHWSHLTCRMALSKRTVELFYDVLSPYSWVAFEVLCRYRPKWNLDLKFCPSSLQGIMGISGNKPPGVVPSKLAYMGKDIKRLRDFYGIPIKAPSDVADAMFVKGSMPAQRLLTVVNNDHPEKVEELSRELWMRIWSRDEDITEHESLQEACRKVGLGDQSEVLLSKIKEQTIKDQLKETTQRALDFGAFGAPTIVAHINGEPQMFFGSDRFLLMAHMFGVEWEGPLRPSSSQL
ncbi:glutathione S-transferase kappa 1-like [Acropora muricata]|uniref:glutathione S-transferase kappa 1-like n=1 Tax=Acropora millepora TaxID=45264 RepID=UPI0010FCAA42|nr:glutathione S-transferase kappa 1-like [Acropora millepora]